MIPTVVWVKEFEDRMRLPIREISDFDASGKLMFLIKDGELILLRRIDSDDKEHLRLAIAEYKYRESEGYFFIARLV